MKSEKKKTTNTQILDKILKLQLRHNTDCFKLNVEADMMQLKYYMEMKMLTMDDEPPKLFKKEYKKWQEELEYYNYKIKKYEEEFHIDSKELEENLKLISTLN